MNFTDPVKCLQTIEAGSDVEYTRATNRQKVNDMLNCVPPITSPEAQRMGLKVNVNWGEAAVLAWHARRQYNNAFLKPARFFKIELWNAPVEKTGDWSRYITKCINRPLKKSREHVGLIQAKHASIVSHGIGPQIWESKFDWLPRYVAIENLRVPTDTKTSLENQVWFAVRMPYTPGELSGKVFGKNKNRGWNKQAVASILKEYHESNYEESNYDWYREPEKLAELYKQNGHFYSGDAVPTIPLWHLYFKCEDGKCDGGWKLRVLPTEHVKGLGLKKVFLFDDGDTVHAEDLSELLHIQFGDLSAKAPFYYHSVRSLGFLLLEPCYYTNLMRCRLVQHVFENFNILFRSSDPALRARAQKIELFDRAFIPEGVGIVPQNERHQIDPQLLTAAMAQLRQLMQEASASYTQEIDSGQRKEQTAYETAVKLQMVNAMLSGLLFHAFVQETFAYREICRRFTLKNSTNEDVKKFQKQCRDYGIPDRFIDVDEWDIFPQIPIGSGNPVAEMGKIEQLMKAKPQFNPEAQQEILHEFTAAVTDDPKTAERLVPLEGRKQVSDAVTYAQFTFPVLMQGLPVAIKPELNLPEQIETYIGMAAGVITRILKTGGMATAQEVVGLRTVEAQIKRLIQMLDQDPAQKPRVKAYSNQVMKLFNEVRAFEQRLQESRKRQNGEGQMDPKVQADIASKMARTQMENELDVQRSILEEERKDVAFENEQTRLDAKAAEEIDRDRMKSLARAPKQPNVKGGGERA